MDISRVTPLALVSLVFVLTLRGQTEGVPALFADEAPRRTTLKLTAPEIVRPPLPLSAHVRAAMTERVAVSVAQAPVVAKPGRQAWLEDHGDAILMDRFVVHAAREKRIEVVSVPTYLANVLLTGEIWTSADKSKSIHWGLSSAETTSYGASANVPRVGLSFSWSW
jgi:hypothetical protein